MMAPLLSSALHHPPHRRPSGLVPPILTPSLSAVRPSAPPQNPLSVCGHFSASIRVSIYFSPSVLSYLIFAMTPLYTRSVPISSWGN